MVPNSNDLPKTTKKTENNAVQSDTLSDNTNLHKALNPGDKKYTVKKENKVWYRRYTLKWSAVCLFTTVFIAGIYSLLTFPYIQKYKTSIWVIFLFLASTFGVTGGVHRLWSHKSYKAKLPLEIIIAVCYITSVEFKIRNWVLLHRVHHKFMETDADPHNIKHGSLYAHIGWLVIQRPKEVIDKYKLIDMRDVDENPVITFCDRYFVLLTAISIIITIMVPVWCWNEELYYSVTSQLARIFVLIQVGLSGNSIAHLYGYKPFNESISATDNGIFSFFSLGEGWHNYHHVFPYDYRMPEFIGLKYDPTATIIEFFEKIGWAYDLRKPSESLIKRVIKNKGDRSYKSLLD